MNNCKEIANNLPLYLDDSLSGADKQTLEEHLKSCPRCTKALVELSKTQILVNNLGQVEPPPWFEQQIMAKVRKEAEKKSLLQKLFYPLRIKISVQIMTTIAIAIFAVYIYRSGDEQMKAVLPSLAPAPIVEVQKKQLPEQKMKTSRGEAIQKEEVMQKRGVPRDIVRQTAVDAAKDVKEQVAVGMRADKYENAPATKSFEQSGDALEKKKESNVSGAAMKASISPQMQSVVVKPNVLLKVVDINIAAGEVDKLLMKYAAKNITMQVAQGKTVLTAELKNREIKDLMTQLKTIGQVEEIDVPDGNAEANFFLVIKIVNN